MSTYNFSNTNLSATPYAIPSYVYQDNEMFTMTIETTAELLRSLVPEPLVPNSENKLVIYVGNLHIVKPVFIDYAESGIMIPVTFGDRAGTFMPVLYLDNLEMLLSGREVWGFPKFRAEIGLQRKGNTLSGFTRDGDIDLIKCSMELQERSEPIPIYDREHFLLKSIPSVTGAGQYDIRQITTCKVTNDTRKEIWRGPLEITLGSNTKNPLGNIPIREIISSVYTVGDITLNHGEVVYDYLTEGK